MFISAISCSYRHLISIGALFFFCIIRNVLVDRQEANVVINANDHSCNTCSACVKLFVFVYLEICKIALVLTTTKIPARNNYFSDYYLIEMI